MLTQRIPRYAPGMTVAVEASTGDEVPHDTTVRRGERGGDEDMDERLCEGAMNDDDEDEDGEDGVDNVAIDDDDANFVSAEATVALACFAGGCNTHTNTQTYIKTQNPTIFSQAGLTWASPRHR
jgi:hypothetical protein